MSSPVLGLLAAAAGLLGVAPALAAPARAASAAQTAPAEAGVEQAAAVPEPEATSLLGEPLERLVPDADLARDQEKLLAKARKRSARRPDDPEPLIWVGRRSAYLGRYQEAIEAFSEGVRRFPEDARFLRHRGHCYLTVRRLEDSVTDLEAAAALTAGAADETEPDGLRRARKAPASTLQSNIWYHLGLARYLLGEFPSAATAYRRCLELSAAPDNRAAATYWLTLALWRSGTESEVPTVLASITADLDVVENGDYRRSLLFFKGELAEPEVLAEGRQDPASIGAATILHGVGAWRLIHGDAPGARELLEEVLAGGNWPAFGHLAAEVELERLRSDASLFE